MSRYILAVDQSTQGTKGLLFDENGLLTARADRSHRQIINEKGWVEHDPEEIFQNTLSVCCEVITKAGVSPADAAAIGLSNQRETALMWDKATGRPVSNAIVWQCARAVGICERPEISRWAEEIRRKTGLNLSPYFPAAKLCWLLENVPEARDRADKGRLACGTVDSWLVYCLTGHHKIAFQIAELVELMRRDSGIPVDALRVDGGPTASTYLMQSQSDIADARVQVPDLQELSGMGAAYAAGIAIGLYNPGTVYQHIRRCGYEQKMSPADRAERLAVWRQAVRQALCHA